MGKAITSESAGAEDVRASRGRNLKSLVGDFIEAIVAGREAQIDYRRQIAHGIDHEEAVKTVLRH